MCLVVEIQLCVICIEVCQKIMAIGGGHYLVAHDTITQIVCLFVVL